MSHPTPNRSAPPSVRSTVVSLPTLSTDGTATGYNARRALMPQRPLLRILGLSFGLAVILGGTIGVGILRTPGSVAAALGSRSLI
ncbi:MAG: hypothetical protein ACRD3V_26195, partial [Vicinamibacteria bacterium]